MKHTPHFIVLSVAFMTMMSCKKTDDVPKQTSSLAIINCTTDGTTLFSEFYGGKTSFADRTLGIDPPSVGGFAYNLLEKGLSAGTVPVKLYVFPDSASPVFSVSKTLQPGGIYSLFVSGTKSSLDTFFVAEQVPIAPQTDTVIFVRIVNLDKESGPVSINLPGKNPLPSMGSLAYKTASPYETFSVRKKDVDTEYLNFEVRSASGTLLHTINYRWKIVNSPTSFNHKLSRHATVALVRLGNETKSIVIDPTLYN